MLHISTEESRLINIGRLCGVLGVVAIHCRLNSPVIVSQVPEELLEQVHSWYCLLTFFPALSMLFMLSGYLFFRDVGEVYGWKENYWMKLKRRGLSLGLFYVIWTVGGFLFSVFIRKDMPEGVTIERFLDSGMGMWYIRSLMCFSLLSPLYYFIVRYLKHLTPVVCVLLSPVIPINFVWFNVYILLGAYLAYHGISLMKIASLLDWRMAVIAYFGMMVASAFWGIRVPGLVTIFVALAVCRGILLCVPIPTSFVAGSTFIYVAHFYIVGGMKKGLFALLPHEFPYYLLNMLVNFTVTPIICIAVYIVIRRFPRVCMLMTGGRG